MTISDPTSTPISTREIGNRAEKMALDYLAGKGFRLIRRNYRAGRDEIDLIMGHRGVLVFVEVKARSTTRFGLPQDAVDSKKKSRLIRCAYRYLIEHDRLDCDCRFDVIAIQLNSRNPLIEHFQAAFIVESHDIPDFDHFNQR
ncbi:MAG: YraN family protein [Candidatus Cloacimonetes bacterium 4572_55]|nr:MAG: YraN family protein [Candidatus Cloacimonetes bacterium 4572_55]